MNKYSNSTLDELDDSNLQKVDNNKFLLRENKLLFKLNNELQEKCDILKENIQLLKLNIQNNNDRNSNIEISNSANSEKNNMNKTFSEALLTDNKKDATFFIKASNIRTALQDFKATISPTELHAKVNFIKQMKNGNIIINCDNEDYKKY